MRISDFRFSIFDSRTLARGRGHRLAQAACAVALLGLVLMASGCGYGMKSTYPSGVSTVAVPIFDNRSFYRGVEQDLTEALVKEIELRTPYKVVAQGTADTVLQGTVVSVSQRQLSRRRDVGVPQELEVRLVVDFVWRNLRTGQTLRQRSGFESVDRYVPTSPVGEGFAVGQHGAVARAATDIVSEMRADW